MGYDNIPKSISEIWTKILFTWDFRFSLASDTKLLFIKRDGDSFGMYLPRSLWILFHTKDTNDFIHFENIILPRFCFGLNTAQW